MYGAMIDSRGAFGGLIQVRKLDDIEFLVKESEVVTGKPGRQFVISGADRIHYRIQWNPSGYQIQRLDAAGNPTSTLYMKPESLDEHSLGDAMREGFLFTHTLTQ
ncbi:MAG: hypothetical protein V4568_12610 [Pseudomonadota bacterium]